MFQDLTGRHAVVTGASSGLGRHFATLLAQHGMRVSLAARREDALADAVEAILAAGGTALGVAMDVIDAGEVVRALDQAVEAHGPIEVLVNNAGITGTAPALDVELRDWSRVIDTNLTGAWIVAQEVARRLVARPRTSGSIVNIASVLGLRVAGGVAPYSVSKAGIVQMTKALALEWARHGIRVNALAPGYIETDLNREFFESDAGKALIRRIPQRRLGRMQDLDVPLLLLASDAGAYMTGSVLTVDGGHLVSGL